MDFPAKELISSISSLKEEEQILLLAGFDEQGLLLAPDETAENFSKRLLLEAENIQRLRSELETEGTAEPLIGLKLKKGTEIPDEIMEEGAEVTGKYYGFEIKWVPGFFPASGLGLLWGGCSISSSEDTPTLFIIRKSFRTSKRFFIYMRDELISHELCHIARMPLNDQRYEEHFAYAHSHSALRRYTGNCFKSEKDALLFILPIFLLLLIQIMRVSYTPNLPSLPFWILAFVWPFILIVSNVLERKRYFAAEKLLKKCGISRPECVLFRCVAKEIEELAAISKEPDRLEKAKAYLQNKKSSDLRWKVIFRRFAAGNNPAENDKNNDILKETAHE